MYAVHKYRSKAGAGGNSGAGFYGGVHRELMAFAKIMHNAIYLTIFKSDRLV